MSELPSGQSDLPYLTLKQTIAIERQLASACSGDNKDHHYNVAAWLSELGELREQFESLKTESNHYKNLWAQANDELEKAKQEVVTLRLVIAKLNPCRIETFSSQCCELGIRGCNVRHFNLEPSDDAPR